jgi:thiamine transporter
MFIQGGFFMNTFLSHEDGYFALTKAGTWALIILAVLLVVLVAFLKGKKTEEAKSVFSVRQLVFSGLSLALAFALSYVKLFKMPWGGSVTLCSMLFVALIGYWYGPKIGFIASFAYSILQFVQDGGSYVLSPMQVIFDYFLAFTLLGASGFFSKKKNGLIVGFIVAAMLRALSQSIAGYIYWMEYMPDNFPKNLAPIYPIAYNYSFVLVEVVITVVVLLLPPVKKAFAYTSKLANGETN